MRKERKEHEKEREREIGRQREKVTKQASGSKTFVI